jgi:putative transposase
MTSSRPHLRQLSLRFRTWGGARKRAGRPPTGERAGVAHLRRPSLSERHPNHVTLKLRPGIESLRQPALFRAVRTALAAGKDRFGFRLVHFSVQRDHLHLLAEAADRRALARGVQGLSIRVARAVNRQQQRTGRVFADRYHARALKTPRAVQFAMRYVLLNARKHERGTNHVAAGFIDACSSAAWLAETAWRRPAALAFGARQCRADWAKASRSSENAPVAAPQTWLLRIGYLRAGLIDVDDAPAQGPSIRPSKIHHSIMTVRKGDESIGIRDRAPPALSKRSRESSE